MTIILVIWLGWRCSKSVWLVSLLDCFWV
jgi:hypothetical protein